ncbi:uncharacterized protein E0L32_010320 [Thyridium curvatum]|uniref:Uncharacterized protein n=1 Tax=Thyridium curvatum TaxID=1093900 RepID=A0A507ASU2_9PEZI|nr:uncharacterized protein E0L32_010320 [Thyridium curvatum]TPX07989.1 hypothetical protein E0L32_010320 [Thyridium curvatum]
MALARSASGPGGLSINTGAANLFGSSTSQAPTAGGLFGGGAQSNQPAPAGGLFGTTAPSQPAQTGGSLFGNAPASGQTQQSGAQPQTSSLFGSTAAASQPQASGGGLFGTASTAQAKPAGGLFGSAATTTSQPQQSGGLFGTAATSAQPQTTGGLFGTSAQQQQQQQQPQQSTGGLFGGSLGTSSLFGKPQQPQLQQQQAPSLGGGLFGQSKPAGTSLLYVPTLMRNTKTHAPLLTMFDLSGGSTMGASSIGPGLTMGQSTNSQQQVVPGVRIDVSNIKPTTRFNDLQEELQQRITLLDNFIQGCIQQKNQVDAFMPAHGEQLEAIPTDVKFVARKYDGVANALASDAQTIDGLRELVKVDADHARMSFKAVENLKLPAQYHTSGLWSARQQQQDATNPGQSGGDSSDVINFFSKTSDEMDEQLKKFTSNLSEIEMHMHGVQSNLLETLQRVSSQSTNGAQAGADSRVAELAAVLRDFEESILKVAGVIGGAREEMTELQLGAFMGNSSNGLR